MNVIRRKLCCVCAGMVTLLVTVSSVFAQPKPGYLPSSTHVFPAGGRRGTTVELRVGAECTPPGTNFWVNGKGLAAANVLEKRLATGGEKSPRRKPTEIPITYPKEWASRIEISSDAPLGPALWRIASAQGGTASRPFVVGDLPEYIERESNSTPDRAESITLPVTVNGQIYGERDADYFRFAANAGDVVVCDVLAGRIGSRLDPIIEIRDFVGRRVPLQEVHVGSDPVLAFRADSDQEYLLRISNVGFQGSPAHVYRITISTAPFYYSAFPAGGQAGTKRHVEFVALSGTSSPRIIKKQVVFPAEISGKFVYRNPSTSTNAIRFNINNMPNMIETEPNDSPPTAMELSTLPVTVDARLMSKEDVDWFYFPAEKDDRLSFTCAAAPVTSVAFPTLSIFSTDGKLIRQATAIDNPDRRCRIDWKVPQTGTYRLRVRDLQYGARGGADFIYRLSVTQSQPDFELSLPSDVVNVVQEGKGKLTVHLTRLGGFDGSVALRFVGLPDGIQIENQEIAKGKNDVTVTMSADENIRSDSWKLRLIGMATVDQKTVERVATAASLGVDSEGVSVAGEPSRVLFLTVPHKPLFRLFCAEAYQYAHRGSVFPYPMQVERLDGFDGDITLQIGDRQNRDLDGIEMFEVIIPSGKTEIDLPIYLPETMHINVQSQSQLYSQAYATFTDKHNRRQSLLVLSEKRNLIRTQPVVVKLKAVDEELSVQPGMTIGCRLKLQRTTNFPGPMQLQLLAPAPSTAEGFTVNQATIAAGQTEITVPVQVSAQQVAGATETLRFRAIGKLDGKYDIITEATIRLRFE